jgi:2-hydroxychromene-2-carboxylate isomerase
MSKRIEFIFDFASPNAYLAHGALGPLLERSGAEVEIKPCLLGGIFKATGNQPPIIAFASIPAKLDYMNAEMQRFMGRHGLTKFRFNEHFPINTLLMARGALVARQSGHFDEYLQAGLAAMWEEGLKMDDPEIFAGAFTAAGFDGASLLEATQQPEIKAALIANTASAVARGAFGIPTFFLDGEMFFGKDSLPDLEYALGQS